MESLKRFELTDKEQNIILRHMWPLTSIPPSSLEGLVVSIIDKICAVEEIIHVEDSEVSHFKNDLSTRDESFSKRKSRFLFKGPFFIKARIIASRSKALITG